jgi:hypothetical protein
MNATSTAPQLGDVDDSWPKLHCRTRFRPSAVRRRACRVSKLPSTGWEICMCYGAGSGLCSSLTLAAVDPAAILIGKQRSGPARVADCLNSRKPVRKKERAAMRRPYGPNQPSR